MTKVVAIHPDRASAGQDALKTMDDWKSDMTPQSKAVIIYEDVNGHYQTFAVNCNMTDALGYVVIAQDMLLHQVRPQ